MTDIVEQLRNPALKGFYLRTEAADEIERLRAELKEVQDAGTEDACSSKSEITRSSGCGQH
jgi:hypothetical protein